MGSRAGGYRTARFGWVILATAVLVCSTPAAWAQPAPPTIQGLVFVDRPDALQRTGVVLDPAQADRVDLSRTPRLDTPGFRRAAASALGRPLTLDSIRALSANLNRFLADGGQPFAIANVPPQDVTNGVVQVVVVQGVLEAVRVEGERWFDAADYRGVIRAVPGQPIDKPTLDQDLALINRNPYRQAAVIAQPGPRTGTTDLLLRTEDRFPVGVDFAFDNTGPSDLGTYRVTMGAEYGDLFGRGDVASYHYTADSEFRLLAQHVGAYAAVLPWHDVLSITGSYASVTSDLPAPLSLHGFSWQVSPRYEVSLAPLGSWLQHLDGGIDFKRSNSNLLFSSIPVSGGTLDIFQFVGTYGVQVPDAFGTTLASVTATVSPGGVTTDNGDAAFVAKRAGADSQYAYLTVNLGRDNPLPAGFLLSSRLRGQVASTALEGTEQLEFGGFAGVRGYRPGRLFADQGVVQRNELAVAPIATPIAALRALTPRAGQLDLYGFFDWGVSSDRHPLPGDTPQSFAGTGIGLRYAFDRFMHARLEYGVPLISVAANGSNAGQFYIGLAIAY